MDRTDKRDYGRGVYHDESIFMLVDSYVLKNLKHITGYIRGFSIIGGVLSSELEFRGIDWRQ